jgi:predicted nuclease of restriction endonuclease-like (RecB) superfamily
MVLLYWDIGRLIMDRQCRDGWGSKVIDRLARDLRRSFPEMQGFSARNLQFMRSFAAEYPDAAIVKQLASKLPWWHLVRLMQRVKDSCAREWYMREAIRQGWSRSVLELEMLGNDQLRHAEDQPTIGLLLCRSKQQVVVKPIGVAGWEPTLAKILPDEYAGNLPSVEELEAELSDR